MNRREFLSRCIAAGLSLGTGGIAACIAPETPLTPEDRALLKGLTIADAHAHPHQLHGSTKIDSATPTVEMMREAGMAACAFSAVGDMAKYGDQWGTPFSNTMNQLRRVKRLEEKDRVRTVRRKADVPSSAGSDTALAAVMAIEGGDALEGNIENLDAFHAYGVRWITVMHDHNNEIGYHQRSDKDGPLTPFGVRVVERMNEMGMIVDVAHARTQTLKSIRDVSSCPVVDSHTNPLPFGHTPSRPTRLRTWTEMEWIAETGGIVCTWPLAYSGRSFSRTTLRDWAEEILEMKARLGIEHVGLGTDGGGNLPRKVQGWSSILSLPGLIRAMREAGLSRDDIAAYTGGNLLRVLHRCLEG